MLHLLGLWFPPYGNPLRGDGYQFWSGIGSDLGELTLVAGVLTLVGMVWHHLNCHAPGCKRIAVHHFHDPETGEVHSLCRAHHPALERHSLAHIHAQIEKSRLIRRG